MLCPVCATEMNNSLKCPFCGHVCEPGEDNMVTLNGEVISTGHRNHWCQTTDDQHLAGKVVDGTHYHPQETYATGQAAVDPKLSESNLAGQFGQNISINGDLIPYNPNGDIDYQHSGWSGMQMQMPGSEGEFQRRKENKAAKWVLITILLLGWGLPFLFFIIGGIIVAIGQG